MKLKLSDTRGWVIESVSGLFLESETVTIFCDKGAIVLKHWHDCCEQVFVEDFDGDPEALVGATIADFREDTSDVDECLYGVSMHTFYNLITDKHDAMIRWYGESNGFYSISVDVSVTSA
jgi:hypothetical protein